MILLTLGRIRSRNGYTPPGDKGYRRDNCNNRRRNATDIVAIKHGATIRDSGRVVFVVAVSFVASPRLPAADLLRQAAYTASRPHK
jgi:hypothetical protein